MKNRIDVWIKFWLLTFLVTGSAFSVLSQSQSHPYFIEGNEVVFVFDVRAYTEALKGANAEKVDFADLKIHEVAISGDFNDWSRKGWRMERKGEFLFELRKSLEDFNDPFPIEFKYIINGKFI